MFDLLLNYKWIPVSLQVFTFVVFGFAFYEVTTEWNKAGALLLAPFKAVNTSLNIPPPWDGTLTALLLFVIVLLALAYVICTAGALAGKMFF